MIVLLDLVDHFNTWSGIHINVKKCKISAFVQDLQTIPRKRDRDVALQARLARVNLAERPIGSLTQYETLPCGYLGTALTASICPYARLH
jgi:hypothetical protein